MKILKKIFFAALFLSLTFPRAGFYFRSLPVTIANILLGIVSLVWLFKRIYQRKFPKGFLEWVGFVYFGYVFFSSLLGLIHGEMIKAVTGLVIMAGYGVLFFATLNFLKSRRDVLSAAAIIIISMVLTVCYGALQVAVDIEAFSLPGLTELYGSPKEPVEIFEDGWTKIISGPAASKNTVMIPGVRSASLFIGHKIFSTFHHGNLFGLHLATFIPLVFSLGLTFPFKKRIVFFILFIAAMIVLIFTNSRGALFGLGIGLLSLILSLSFRDWFKIFPLLVISFLLFIFIISQAVLYNYKITKADPSLYFCYNFEPRYVELCRKIVYFWQTRFKSDARSENFGLEIDGLVNWRFSCWRGVLKTIFKNRPPGELLLGNAFYKRPCSKYYNFYLWMIFEIGLIGFGLFILFLGGIIKLFFRSLAFIEDEKLKAVAMGGLGGIIAGLVHNLFDAPFVYPPILANFWVLAGIVMVSVKKN